MILCIKLIGIVLVMTGGATLVKPAFLKKLIANAQKGKLVYWITALKLLFGGILILASAQSRLPDVIKTLGIITVIGCIVGFALGEKRLKAWCGWWEKRPSSVYRLWALAVVALGVLLVYAA